MKNTLRPIFLFFILVVCYLQGKAQKPCGSGDLHQLLMNTDTAYRKENTAAEEEIYKNLSVKAMNKMQTPVYTIPVVVHVIHKGEAVGSGSNIATNNILNAIQTLNNSFRNVNNQGVDVQINFKLATTDPNGNATTGINRVNGTVVAGYATGGINNYLCPSTGASETAVKDLSKWPVKSYLNIWLVYTVCNFSYTGIATGITGSAYNGVCVTYSRLSSATDLTITHEVGHMLGLNHTFQGDDAAHVICPADSACAFNGDKVCDTPPHRQWDSVTTPCVGPGVWNNSRYNYMSYNHTPTYSPQAVNATTCRFTQGQKDRMRAVLLTNSTKPYLDSKGALPPATLNDAGVERFILPVANHYSFSCAPSDSVFPVVELKNYGTASLLSAIIRYRVDNGALQTYNWIGNLLTDSSVFVTLPALVAIPGNHTMLAFTNLPNNTADGYTANDSADLVFILKRTKPFNLSGAATGVSFGGSNNGSATVAVNRRVEIREDFEGNTDWIISNGSEVNKWKIGNAVSNGGNKSIYITSNDSTNFYDTINPSVVHFYKDFYFPAGATNIKIKFDWRCQGQIGGVFGSIDQLKVYLKSTSQSVIGLGEQQSGTFIGQYYLQSSFRTDSIMGLDSIAGSSKRLIFSWRNNQDLGVQPPAAVDNLMVSYDLPVSTAYTYLWNSIPPQFTATATGLAATQYKVIVTDATNCIDSILLTVPQLLPVQLVSFSGYAAKNNAVLEWVTAEELNSDRFELERSDLNSNWENIGWVTAKRNEKGKSSYLFTDENAFLNKEKRYYRLKMVDINGSTRYSKNVVLTRFSANIKPAVRVSPNPSNATFNFDLLDTLIGNRYSVQVFNATGIKVLERYFDTGGHLKVDTALPGGVYYYRLLSDDNFISGGKIVLK